MLQIPLIIEVLLDTTSHPVEKVLRDALREFPLPIWKLLAKFRLHLGRRQSFLAPLLSFSLPQL